MNKIVKITYGNPGTWYANFKGVEFYVSEELDTENNNTWKVIGLSRWIHPEDCIILTRIESELDKQILIMRGEIK